MKYKSCKDIESSLLFIHNTLAFCCSCGSVGDFIYSENYKGEEIDYADFLRVRNEFRQRFIDDTIDDRCRNCSFYQEDDWDEDFKLSYICIAHRTKCSCDCFYCNFAKEKDYYNTREVYNIIPAYKKLLEDFPLSEELMINLVGGECTEYPEYEFNGLVDLGSKKNAFFNFTTSGIFYKEKIAKVLQKELGDISVSPDSGTRETYYKIKRVDKFNDVWNNLAKYSKFCKKTGYKPLRIKYIVIPGINDNRNEFKSFYEKCQKVGNCKIEISLEYSWFEKNKDKQIPENLLEFFYYIKILESKIHISYVEAAVPFIRKIRENFNMF